MVSSYGNHAGCDSSANYFDYILPLSQMKDDCEPLHLHQNGGWEGVKAFYKKKAFIFIAKWLKDNRSRFLLPAMHNV